MSEEPTDQEAKDAAAKAMLFGDAHTSPWPNDAATHYAITSILIEHLKRNDEALTALYCSLDLLAKQKRENPPLPSIEERVAALEAFIKEAMHE
jgi:hypothetical protein